MSYKDMFIGYISIIGTTALPFSLTSSLPLLLTILDLEDGHVLVNLKLESPVGVGDRSIPIHPDGGEQEASVHVVAVGIGEEGGGGRESRKERSEANRKSE